MFDPLIVMALLFAWCGSFVMIFVGHDIGDKPTLVAGIVVLVMTSFVLVFH